MRIPKIRAALSYFSKAEWLLWGSSVLLIVASFCIFDRTAHLTLIASLIGVTSLIFNAKGNPVGQVLVIVFSILYGIISFSFAYYGEMITYLGMTAPMALFALISWLTHPYNGNRAQVRVNQLKRREILLMAILTATVSVGFYFILKAFATPNLLPSTVSVATSFLAVYLTFRRSAYYAVAYAANDVVLLVLWGMATASNIAYLSVVICFAMFLLNDIYGFLNWSRMQKQQQENADG